MGGVDLADMLIALYKTEYKSHRWYMNIFSQLLDICVTNAWLLYKRDYQLTENKECKTLLKVFRQDIAISLTKYNRAIKSRPSKENINARKSYRQSLQIKPKDDFKFDNIGHYPIFRTKGRCRYCPKGQTSITCIKCDMRLCFVEGRNCFYDFHNKR